MIGFAISIIIQIVDGRLKHVKVFLSAGGATCRQALLSLDESTVVQFLNKFNWCHEILHPSRLVLFKFERVTNIHRVAGIHYAM